MKTAASSTAVQLPSCGSDLHAVWHSRWWKQLAALQLRSRQNPYTNQNLEKIKLKYTKKRRVKGKPVVPSAKNLCFVNFLKLFFVYFYVKFVVVTNSEIFQNFYNLSLFRLYFMIYIKAVLLYYNFNSCRILTKNRENL